MYALMQLMVSGTLHFLSGMNSKLQADILLGDLKAFYYPMFFMTLVTVFFYEFLVYCYSCVVSVS